MSQGSVAFSGGPAQADRKLLVPVDVWPEAFHRRSDAYSGIPCASHIRLDRAKCGILLAQTGWSVRPITTAPVAPGLPGQTKWPLSVNGPSVSERDSS